MRTIYRLNGKRIDISNQITIDGVTYPNLRDVWQSVGVVQAEVEDYPDIEDFTWTENEDGTLNVTPHSPEFVENRRKDRVKQQIANIEAGQARAVREAALGNTTHLQQIETQIAALRAQL